MTEIDTNKPTVIGRLAAVCAGVLATLAAGAYSLSAMAIGLVGLTVLSVGLLLPRPGVMSLGSLGLFGGAMVAAADNVPVGAVLVATIGAILAWDAAQNGASHARQVGASAQTLDAEMLHLAGSFGVGLLTAGIAYLGYRSASTGQPATGIAILLFGCLLLIVALR